MHEIEESVCCHNRVPFDGLQRACSAELTGSKWGLIYKKNMLCPTLELTTKMIVLTKHQSFLKGDGSDVIKIYEVRCHSSCATCHL